MKRVESLELGWVGLLQTHALLWGGLHNTALCLTLQSSHSKKCVLEYKSKTESPACVQTYVKLSKQHVISSYQQKILSLRQCQGDTQIQSRSIHIISLSLALYPKLYQKTYGTWE